MNSCFSSKNTTKIKEEKIKKKKGNPKSRWIALPWWDRALGTLGLGSSGQWYQEKYF
jgi:hypothetical protein